MPVTLNEATAKSPAEVEMMGSSPAKICSLRAGLGFFWSLYPMTRNRREWSVQALEI
jgi:hypothetical protein